LRCAVVILVVGLFPVTSWRCVAQSPTGFALLGRGVNYGNMLEAANEGEWGVRFRDEFPKVVKAAGFQTVRLPVRWSAHAEAAAPFNIDREFIARVKHIVECNRKQGLNVVLNVHHYDELLSNLNGHRQRFLSLWRQIAVDFHAVDDRLFFEILNEPHGQVSGEAWNTLVADVVAIIRQHNPTRWIIVGPDSWNGMHRLRQLKLPEHDRRLVATVHFYHPIEFTHQGATFTALKFKEGKAWLGRPEELKTMRRAFTAAAEWARENGRPVYLGEFGTIDKADLQSRVRWTREVRRLCEKADFAWSYWELAAGFGLLDPQTLQWRRELLQALFD
jgi:endoglucanase